MMLMLSSWVLSAVSRCPMSRVLAPRARCSRRFAAARSSRGGPPGTMVSGDKAAKKRMTQCGDGSRYQPTNSGHSRSSEYESLVNLVPANFSPMCHIDEAKARVASRWRPLPPPAGWTGLLFGFLMDQNDWCGRSPSPVTGWYAAVAPTNDYLQRRDGARGGQG